MKKVSKSLTFFALLLVFVTQGAELLYAKRESPHKSFKQRRLELLELDLSSFGPSLSPYQLWLIYFWRGEYDLLLDVDRFAVALESWKQQGSEVTVDLSDLFDDTRGHFFKGGFIGGEDLATMIQNTDFAPYEKDFLELLLIYILNQGEDKFRRGFSPADKYLSKHPDSPFRRFV